MDKQRKSERIDKERYNTDISVKVQTATPTHSLVQREKILFYFRFE